MYNKWRRLFWKGGSFEPSVGRISVCLAPNQPDFRLNNARSIKFILIDGKHRFFALAQLRSKWTKWRETTDELEVSFWRLKNRNTGLVKSTDTLRNVDQLAISKSLNLISHATIRMCFRDKIWSNLSLFRIVEKDFGPNLSIEGLLDQHEGLRKYND